MPIDPRVVDASLESALECNALGWAVVQRLRDGTLPPDDAYWWGRILGHKARRLLPADEGVT